MTENAISFVKGVFEIVPLENAKVITSVKNYQPLIDSKADYKFNGQ